MFVSRHLRNLLSSQSLVNAPFAVCSDPACASHVVAGRLQVMSQL